MSAIHDILSRRKIIYLSPQRLLGTLSVSTRRRCVSLNASVVNFLQAVIARVNVRKDVSVFTTLHTDWILFSVIEVDTAKVSLDYSAYFFNDYTSKRLTNQFRRFIWKLRSKRDPHAFHSYQTSRNIHSRPKTSWFFYPWTVGRLRDQQNWVKTHRTHGFEFFASIKGLSHHI